MRNNPKAFIIHYVKSCSAAVPRDISLSLLTYPYDVKGSLSTVHFMASIPPWYLKTDIHCMLDMCFFLYIYILFFPITQ